MILVYRINALHYALKLSFNIFFFFQMKKILEYFTQNKKNKLAEKIFLSLLEENLT